MSKLILIFLLCALATAQVNPPNATVRILQPGAMDPGGVAANNSTSGTGCPCTYYVAPDGNDSNPGTLALPWLTVAKINSTTLIAGQSVGFKSGGSWREVLTPGQSGSAGSPIVYTSYGGGAQPCIYCEPAGTFTATADAGNMSEWTTTVGTSPITAATAAVYHGSGPGSTGYGFDASSDGTNFGYASKTLGTPCTTCYLRFYLFLPTTWRQASNFQQTYIASLNHGATVLAHIYLQQQGSVGTVQVHGQLNSAGFSNFGTGTITLGVWHRIDFLYVASATIGGIQWWFDGTSVGSSFVQNSTTSTVDTLLLGSISSSPPSAGQHTYFDTVKISPTSTVAVNDAVSINNKSYLTFSNLQVANSGDTGFHLQGGASHINITNSTIHDIDANTFRAAIFNNGSSTNSFQGNTIYNAEDGIAVSGFGSVANAGLQILGNTLYNFGRHGIQVAPAGGTAPSGVTINNNNISYAALWVNDSVGILFDGAGTGNTANHNISFNHGTPIYLGSDYDSDLTSLANIWTFNVGYGSTNGCFILSGSGHFLYQNTCYNDNVGGPEVDGEVSLYTNASNITAKDNIFVCSSGKQVLSVQAGSTTGNVYDYNDFSCATATPFTYSGANYSFSGYQAAATQDAHSITGDPLFTNAGTADFTLQGGSPAIGAGVFIPGVSTANPPNIGAK